MNYRGTLILGLALATAATLPGCSSHDQAEAPAAAEAAAGNPDVHEFHIGTFTAMALRDGNVEFPNDNSVFGVGLTPGDVAEVLSAAGLPTDKLHLGLDPLLVQTDGRVLLFDTGAGGNFGEGAGHLGASLAAAGVDAAGVTDIFISHVHGDHVGGLAGADGNATFPNAAVHISKPEWDFLSGLTSESAGNLGISNYAALIAALSPHVATFEPGAAIIPGVVQAAEIKGHTPGHSGYLIGSGADSLLYIGDAMHHYVVSVQKPEWAIAFDADQQTGIASRGQVLEQAVATGQRIYAVHFPFPGLGRFEHGESGYVWKPE